MATRGEPRRATTVGRPLGFLRKALLMQLPRTWLPPAGTPSACVLMLVQPVERNMYDQHHLAQQLWSSHRIRVVRRTLAEVNVQAAIAKDGSLLM